MILDLGLLVVVAVLLVARVALGRDVPLASFAAVCGVWALVFAARFVQTVLVAFMALMRWMEPSGYEYRGDTGFVSLFDLTASLVYGLLGLAMLATVMLVAVQAPVAKAETPEP